MIYHSHLQTFKQTSEFEISRIVAIYGIKPIPVSEQKTEKAL